MCSVPKVTALNLHESINCSSQKDSSVETSNSCTWHAVPTSSASGPRLVMIPLDTVRGLWVPLLWTLAPDADTCLCTRSTTGGSPAHRGTTVHTHWNLSLYPLHQRWVTCTKWYNSSHTLTPVSIPALSWVGHLHTGVQQFTHTDTCLYTHSVTGGSPAHRGKMVEVHTQQWGHCRCYCLMLIPVSVPALSGVGHLLTGVQNYNGSHTPTPLYLLHQKWLIVHMVTVIYTQQWW